MSGWDQEYDIEELERDMRNDAAMDPGRSSYIPTVLRDFDVLRKMGHEVEAVNRTNGWFDEHRRFGEDIALLHSEVSEMLEAYRDHGLDDVTDRPLVKGELVKPEGVGSEAADVLVRLLDTCSRYNIDLFAEWRRKVTFNASRGYKHGGKNL